MGYGYWFVVFVTHEDYVSPTWLLPLSKLLKLASEYMYISKEPRSNDGILMWLGVFLTNLNILLVDLMSEIVTVLTFVVISQTWELISG